MQLLGHACYGHRQQALSVKPAALTTYEQTVSRWAGSRWAGSRPPGRTLLRPGAWQRPHARLPAGELEAEVVVLVHPPEHGAAARAIAVESKARPAGGFKGRQVPGPRQHLGQVQHLGLAAHRAGIHRVVDVEARAILACMVGVAAWAVAVRQQQGAAWQRGSVARVADFAATDALASEQLPERPRLGACADRTVGR